MEPSFPSRDETSGEELGTIIARDPTAWLGNVVGRTYDVPHLLTKLLDANDNLSLQVHPHVIGAPDGEHSGKHETWVILAHKDGAGIYLGAKPGTDPQELVTKIRERGDVAEHMNFVEVKEGDVFHIRPGTPHAIGKGVTLFEPQAIQPHFKGVTYRCWDWNRLYDEAGKRSEQGDPRELHLERFLEVTAWDSVNSEGFVDSCREIPGLEILHGVRSQRIVESPWYDIRRLTGRGSVELPTHDHFVALTCVGGEVAVETSDGRIELQAGRSCAIPANAVQFFVELDDADVFAVWDTPDRARGIARRR